MYFSGDCKDNIVIESPKKKPGIKHEGMDRIQHFILKNNIRNYLTRWLNIFLVYNQYLTKQIYE